MLYDITSWNTGKLYTLLDTSNLEFVLGRGACFFRSARWIGDVMFRAETRWTYGCGPVTTRSLVHVVEAAVGARVPCVLPCGWCCVVDLCTYTLLRQARSDPIGEHRLCVPLPIFRYFRYGYIHRRSQPGAAILFLHHGVSSFVQLHYPCGDPISFANFSSEVGLLCDVVRTRLYMLNTYAVSVLFQVPQQVSPVPPPPCFNRYPRIYQCLDEDPGKFGQ